MKAPIVSVIIRIMIIQFTIQYRSVSMAFQVFSTTSEQPTTTTEMDLTTTETTTAVEELTTTQTPEDWWSDWADWSLCTKTCEGGEQTRTRECVTQADTQDCTGSATQTRTCMTQQCPLTTEELTFGVLLDVNGITSEQFLQILNYLYTVISSSLNDYCSANSNQVSQCCGFNTTFDPSTLVNSDVVTPSLLALGSGYPKDTTDGISVLLLAQFLSNSTLCPSAEAFETGTAFRKRRSLFGGSSLLLPQEVLETVVSTSISIEATIEVAVYVVLNEIVNITVTEVIAATQVPYYESTTGQPTTETSVTEKHLLEEKSALETWMIALIVVLAFVVLLILLLAVIVVLKRDPNVVHPVRIQIAPATMGDPRVHSTERYRDAHQPDDDVPAVVSQRPRGHTMQHWDTVLHSLGAIAAQQQAHAQHMQSPRRILVSPKNSPFNPNYNIIP